jgi:hypothetical protein
MTLIESCLGLVVVSAITMIAVPSLIRGRESYVLNASARQVATSMHSTRIHAVARNRDCRLRVTSDVSYLIECEDPAWIPVAYETTPRGIYISANARPEFHKRGNVSPTATITLSDRHGRQKKVIVNNAGRVRVQ